MRFEWDPNKELENISKHGVDFTTAQRAFSDPKALVLLDEDHSGEAELRWWLLGKIGERVLLVRYTHRADGALRLIGAGYWKEGRDYYETHWKQISF
ncbi:MAG: uncharacterized protein JWM35_2366 [Verrucomicrobia bacterium]|nr:uncharacterized protein [Verrucomicrobiota bacterium]